MLKEPIIKMTWLGMLLMGSLLEAHSPGFADESNPPGQRVSEDSEKTDQGDVEHVSDKGSPDPYSMSLSDILNINIRSVSKKDERYTDVPSEVTIYTRQDLDRLKPRNLSDLLELTPGFLIGRDTDDISWGSRGVVTDNNQKYMIAIDGHRISNNNNFGVNPFHRTRNLIDIAERIEIVRGSGGVLWGPDAFLGFINIITRKPKSEGKETGASVTYGTDQTIAGNVSYLEDKDGVRISVFADTLHSEGQEISTDLAGKGGVDTRSNSFYERFEAPTVTMNARVETDDSWFSGQVANVINGVEGAPQEDEFNELYVEAGRRFEIDNDQEFSLRLYGDHFEHQRRDADEMEGGIFSSNPETRIGGEALLESQWCDWFSTVAGWDSRYYSYSGGSVGSIDRDELADNFGVLVQNPQFRNENASGIGHYYWNGLYTEGVFNYEKWDLRGGVRYHTYSDSIEDLWAPRASLGYRVTDDFSVRFLYARGALRPSWTQLTGFFSFEGGGNEDLRSELSSTYEVLLKYAQKDLLSSLSIYWADYDRTISFVNSKEGLGFVNYADYRTSGLEWENRVRVTDWLYPFLNFTWYFDVQRDENFSLLSGTSIFGTEGQQVRPGTDEPFNIPDYFFSTGTSVLLPVFGQTLEVTPIARYTGNRFIQPRDGLPEQKNDSLYWDLKMGLKVARNFEAALIAKNVFNNQDAVGVARGIPGLVTPKGDTWELRVSAQF